MTHLTKPATPANSLEADVLPEDQTWVSAFFDGESLLPAAGVTTPTVNSHQYYQYQLIRQTLRGVCIASSTETIAWHQTQCAQLWARVDAQPPFQDN